MNDFNWLKFRDLNIPNNIDLNMTIINSYNIENFDDYVFIENIDNNINNNTINIQKDMNNDIMEQCIFINYDYYVNDIKNSFKNMNDIEKQFRIDIPRSNIFINNHKIISPQIIIDYLNFNFNSNITKKIMMLTTQAFLALPFQLTFNQLYNLDNYHLAEIEYDDNTKQPYRISINILDNDINFKSYKEFRIFRLDNDISINIYKVYIKIEFTLNNEENILMNIRTEKIRDLTNITL